MYRTSGSLHSRDMGTEAESGEGSYHQNAEIYSWHNSAADKGKNGPK